jgi:GxxExxY protein
MLHEELTKKIIGWAMEVHKRLGNGFQDVIYQSALNMEMDIARLNIYQRNGNAHILSGY